MKPQSKTAIELNLRTKAWSLCFDTKNITLTAIHNKINQIHYKGCEIIEDYANRSDDEIQDLIEEFKSRHGVKRGDVFMALPRQEAMIQIAEFPLEAANNLEEVMEYQLGNYFPIDLDLYEFFPQIIGKSDQLKVMILAIEKKYLGHAFGFIRRWNLKLAGLTLDSFAFVNGLAKLDADVFAQARILAFRAYPEGLEMLGLNQGRLVSSHYFNLDPEAGPETMVSGLQQGFSSARMDPNEIDHFFYCGPYFEANRAYLEEQGIPFETWRDGRGEIIPPEALTGIGAAICGVHDKLHLGLNMLPEKQRKRQKRLPVILGTILLCLLAVYFVVHEFNDYQALRDRRARVVRQEKELMEALSQVAAARSDFQNKKIQLELFQRFQTSKMLIKSLDAMARDLPDDTYLTSFQVKHGDELQVQGHSDDPFKIETILKNMPFLTDVTPSNATTSGRNDDGKKRFIYKAKLVLEEFH